jgi:hypothetical protein
MMTKKELGKLAMEILNTANTSGPDTEDGVITVDSNMLFHYYAMRHLIDEGKREKVGR